MILAKFHHVELWTTHFLGVAFLFLHEAQLCCACRVVPERGGHALRRRAARLHSDRAVVRGALFAQRRAARRRYLLWNTRLWAFRLNNPKPSLQWLYAKNRQNDWWRNQSSIFATRMIVVHAVNEFSFFQALDSWSQWFCGSSSTLDTTDTKWHSWTTKRAGPSGWRSWTWRFPASLSSSWSQPPSRTGSRHLRSALGWVKNGPWKRESSYTALIWCVILPSARLGQSLWCSARVCVSDDIGTVGSDPKSWDRSMFRPVLPHNLGSNPQPWSEHSQGWEGPILKTGQVSIDYWLFSTLCRTLGSGDTNLPLHVCSFGQGPIPFWSTKFGNQRYFYRALRDLWCLVWLFTKTKSLHDETKKEVRVNWFGTQGGPHDSLLPRTRSKGPCQMLNFRVTEHFNKSREKAQNRAQTGLIVLCFARLLQSLWCFMLVFGKGINWKKAMPGKPVVPYTTCPSHT